MRPGNYATYFTFFHFTLFGFTNNDQTHLKRKQPGKLQSYKHNNVNYSIGIEEKQEKKKEVTQLELLEQSQLTYLPLKLFVLEYFYSNLLQLNICLLCISTSFWVLRSTQKLVKLLFRPFSTFFVHFKLFSVISHLKSTKKHVKISKKKVFFCIFCLLLKAG